MDRIEVETVDVARAIISAINQVGIWPTYANFILRDGSRLLLHVGTDGWPKAEITSGSETAQIVVSSPSRPSDVEKSSPVSLWAIRVIDQSTIKDKEEALKNLESQAKKHPDIQFGLFQAIETLQYQTQPRPDPIRVHGVYR